ncbi:efflux RND transporter permease subunit [Paracoccus mutanolyticus]|uniref:efflux RND transporter permease subunit n=1 Tax=Paracoccus mutanolyticus TaxID=1499308 RepID=UPI00294FEFF2|nr:efflux RND transporter permease subunit [Paracoccus mutanolyticus]
MFAMVLAIGLLVDDAIVVVENVERVMEEEGLGPVEATEKSMGQIIGALVGIALVLSAVFLPMAFMSGSTGVIYRQFSITIITAMVLSLLVALILTPAMCASLLSPGHGAPRLAPARWFNRGLDRCARLSGHGAPDPAPPDPVMLVLAGIGWGAWDLFGRMTTTFIPAEDQGVLQSRINLTEGSTAQQTAAVVQEIEDYMLTREKDAVGSVFVAMGFGSQGTAQNRATIFVRLKPFAERDDPNLSARAVQQRANRHFAGHRAGGSSSTSRRRSRGWATPRALPCICWTSPAAESRD